MTDVAQPTGSSDDEQAKTGFDRENHHGGSSAIEKPPKGDTRGSASSNKANDRRPGAPARRRPAPRDPKTFIEEFTDHPVVDEVMKRLSR